MHQVMETSLLLGCIHAGTDGREWPLSLRNVRQGSKGAGVLWPDGKFTELKTPASDSIPHMKASL